MEQRCRRKVSIIPVMYVFIHFDIRFSRITFLKQQTCQPSDSNVNHGIWQPKNHKSPSKHVNTSIFVYLELKHSLAIHTNIGITWMLTTVWNTLATARWNFFEFRAYISTPFYFPFLQIFMFPRRVQNDEKMCQSTWKITNC